MLTMDEITSSYYLRVQAEDEPGVLGQIANLLAKEGVSIEALIQKGVIDGGSAEIVILTHSTVEKNIKTAIAAIEALNVVQKPVVMIRMEMTRSRATSPTASPGRAPRLRHRRRRWAVASAS